MLKRAVFGFSRIPASKQKAILNHRESNVSGSQDEVRRGLPRGKYQQRRASPTHQEWSSGESDNDECDEPYKVPESDSSEGEVEDDPQARRALIRRAARMFATDKKMFIRAMSRHEDIVGEDDASESELELLDPESDTSVGCGSSDEGTSRRGEHSRRHEADEGDFKRGKFHCKLCPKKIFIFEADLEKHLQSKVHLKREREWERSQAASECKGASELAKTKAMNDSNEETDSSFARPVRSDCAPKRRRQSDKTQDRKPRSQRRRDVALLTPEEIEKRKLKFQKKKERRLQRKAQESASS